MKGGVAARALYLGILWRKPHIKNENNKTLFFFFSVFFFVGYQMKSAFEGGLQGLPDWKSHIPYSQDSFQRHIYRKPEQQEELKGHTTRYASNKNKLIPAYGGGTSFINRTY